MFAVLVVVLLNTQTTGCVRSGGLLFWNVCLTTVVLVAVVVTVQVSVTSLGCQDAATWPTLEVAGGALCCQGNTPTNNNKENIKIWQKIRMCFVVLSWRTNSPYRRLRPLAAGRLCFLLPPETDYSRSPRATAVPQCRAPTHTSPSHYDTTTCRSERHMREREREGDRCSVETPGGPTITSPGL